MSVPAPANIKLVNTQDYREGYANSVQIRASVWDFLLVFGRLQQQTTTEVEVHNFQGIYLSPQQAKALMSILEQNVLQYEKTFGEIKLDPTFQPHGAIKGGTA
jgi:flagellar protein FlaG